MVIGALLVVAFSIGAILTAALLRPGQNEHEYPSERDYSKFPAEHNSPNASLLIAIADEIQYARKDANAKEADKRYIEILTLLGVCAYTVITFLILLAALYQSTIAKDTERRQLRAYLGPFGNFEIKCPSEDRRIPPSNSIIPNNYVSYKIRNYGGTPTYDVNICFNFLGIGKDESIEERRNNYFRRCDAKRGGHPAVWPSEEPPDEMGNIRSIDEIVDIVDSKRAGFFVGRIKYEDIWGNPHTTYICRRVVPIVREKTVEFHIIGCDTGTEGPKDD